MVCLKRRNPNFGVRTVWVWKKVSSRCRVWRGLGCIDSDRTDRPEFSERFPLQLLLLRPISTQFHIEQTRLLPNMDQREGCLRKTKNNASLYSPTNRHSYPTHISAQRYHLTPPYSQLSHRSWAKADQPSDSKEPTFADEAATISGKRRFQRERQEIVGVTRP